MAITNRGDFTPQDPEYEQSISSPDSYSAPTQEEAAERELFVPESDTSSNTTTVNQYPQAPEVAYPAAHEAPQKRSKVGLAIGGALFAGGLAAGAMFGLNSGGGESGETSAEQELIADETPEVTVAAPEEATKDNSTEAGSSDGEFMVTDEGFVVPETRTPIIDTAPELYETNNTEEVFEQISNILSYYVNTGDESLLEYAIGSANSDGAVFFRKMHETAVQAKENMGFPDFYYYLKLTPETNIETLAHNADGSGTAHISKVNRVEAAFGGTSDKPLYQLLISYDLTLERQAVYDEDFYGRHMWVLTKAGPATHEELIDRIGFFAQSE